MPSHRVSDALWHALRHLAFTLLSSSSTDPFSHTQHRTHAETSFRLPSARRQVRSAAANAALLSNNAALLSSNQQCQRRTVSPMPSGMRSATIAFTLLSSSSDSSWPKHRYWNAFSSSSFKAPSYECCV